MDLRPETLIQCPRAFTYPILNVSKAEVSTVITWPVSQHRSVPQHEFLPTGMSLGLKILHEPWQC